MLIRRLGLNETTGGSGSLLSGDNRPASNEVQPTQMRLYWLLFGAVLLVLLVPIWSTPFLPLVDYPHALSRAYIAAHYDEFRSFQQLYERPLAIVPNMGFELIAAAVGPLLGTELLGRLAWSLTIGLFAVGCHLLARVFAGKPLWSTLPVLFFIYSTHLFYGNINFLMGLGLFLITYSLWRSTYEAHPWRAAVLLLLLTPLAFLVHLATFAFAATAMGITLLFGLREKKIGFRHALATVLPMTVTLLLFRLFLTHGGTVGEITFNSPIEKVLETASLFSSYRHGWDALYLISLLGTAIYLFRKKSGISFQKEALAIGCTFYLFLWLCPGTLFTSSGADVRFLIPGFVFALLSVRIVLPARAMRNALAAVLILGAVRVALIGADWRSLSDRVAPQIALWQRLPHGARAYPLYYRDSLAPQKEGKLLPVIGLYGILSGQIYNPIFYAFREQHPIVFRRELGYQPMFTATDLTPRFQANLLANYDYIWCYRLTQQAREDLARHGEMVDSAEGAYMLKVRSER